MSRGEKLLGAVVALLWAALLMFLVSGCGSAPTGVEWDECYETIDFEGNDVTYCQKDTVMVH